MEVTLDLWVMHLDRYLFCISVFLAILKLSPFFFQRFYFGVLHGQNTMMDKILKHEYVIFVDMSTGQARASVSCPPFSPLIGHRPFFLFLVSLSPSLKFKLALFTPFSSPRVTEATPPSAMDKQPAATPSEGHRRNKAHATEEKIEDGSSTECEMVQMTEQEEDLINRMFNLVESTIPYYHIRSACIRPQSAILNRF
ncbi:hypothetical protein MA16_Dca014562 [Dendrobium catenatum]|uniref:Uncharacterized protein n=1 Tax=Dendrobium catenatum TaxID=906689 RepID=A0A2I0XJP9_9ASPA|nr:hypothetical protein MA16_Dca014562 [Dendrobium catenatum]